VVRKSWAIFSRFSLEWREVFSLLVPLSLSSVQCPSVLRISSLSARKKAKVMTVMPECYKKKARILLKTKA
jgi:hypothetical protein